MPRDWPTRLAWLFLCIAVAYVAAHAAIDLFAQ